MSGAISQAWNPNGRPSGLADTPVPRTAAAAAPTIARNSRRVTVTVSPRKQAGEAGFLKNPASPRFALEVQLRVEREEPHHRIVDRSNLTEVRARRVQFGIRVVLPIEKVLDVDPELERPAAAQT